MAKVIHFYQPGPPEVQCVEEVVVPDPGPGEVQIQVAAIGLNRSDLIFRSGHHPLKPRTPSGNGAEGAGVVARLGPGVSGFAAGDAVSVVPHMDPTRGTYGELINIPAPMVMASSSYLDTAGNAAFWASYLTAHGGLINIANLGAGDTVLITAASSSVGLAAIQVANMVGATAVAITRGAAKAERLCQAGAAHVLVMERDDVGAAVAEITGGEGARVVFDPVGGPGTAVLAEAMAMRGIYVLYGAMSGEATPFPVAAAFDKLLTMTIYRLDYVNRHEELERDRTFLDEGLASGALRPTIDQVFPFTQVVEAHRHMASNEQFGKIVLAL